MQGLVLADVGHIVLAKVTDPGIQAPGDAVIAVDRAGLCGSDLHPYLGAEPAATGVVCGHEAVGRVVAVGEGVRRFLVGDRVVVPFTTSCGTCPMCRSGLTARCPSGRLFGWAPPGSPTEGLPGCQATLVGVPLADGTLIRLPDDIDDDTGVLLADNLPTAWEAVARARCQRGSTLAVIGLGAVGLCAVGVALSDAVRVGRVVAIDPVASRRAAASALGAEVLSPEEADDLRVPSVVEAAGPAAAQDLAAQIASPGASISIIAVQTRDAFGISAVTAYDKNLTISCGRASVRSTLNDVLPLISSGQLVVPTAAVVSHPGRPLTEGPNLYAAFANRQDGLIKATFSPSRTEVASQDRAETDV